MRFDLRKAGFSQDTDVPNLWVKNGVAISEEQAKKIGLIKALARHASHAAGIEIAKTA